MQLIEIAPARMAEILEKAADLYESETIDWCQNQNFSPGTEKVSACAQGAIYLAMGTHRIRTTEIYYYGHYDGRLAYTMKAAEPCRPTEWSKRLSEAELVIHKLGQALKTHVPSFNDMVGRTKQEVIDMMKDTAKELRNGQ